MFSSTITNLIIICCVGFSHCLIVYNFRTCLELGEICREVGLPPGVLNIVTGLGHEAGASLASHPDVDKVQLILAISGTKTAKPGSISSMSLSLLSYI